MRIIYGFVLAFILALFIPVYAQGISVSTDRISYQENEIIVISGKVSQVVEKIPLEVRIMYGEYDNVVTIAQIYPVQYAKAGQPVIREDGTWTLNVNTGGSIWSNSDQYKVKVSYNNAVAETSFLYSVSNDDLRKFSWGIDGTDFLVEYSIRNGQILDMIYDKNAKELKVIVDGFTHSNGMLILTDIPGKLLNVTTPISISVPIGVNQIVIDATTQYTQTTVQPQNTQETPQLNTIDDVISIPQTAQIPEWVKGVFKYWSDGNISDQELISAIKFLVKSGIIEIN